MLMRSSSSVVRRVAQHHQQQRSLLRVCNAKSALVSAANNTAQHAAAQRTQCVSTSAAAAASTPVTTNAKWETCAAPSAAHRNEEGVSINSAFDSGNIEVADMSSTDNILLNIHMDPYCETDEQAHAMWFNYRMTGVLNRPLTMHICNAGQCSFPEAWEGYMACASYDLENWFRVPTTYDSDKGVLTIKHTPECDAVQYAYFAPYTYNRHRTMIMKFQSKPGVKLHMLGETVDGHDLDVLQFGESAPNKRKVWIVARQHPGESQAEWFAEGLMDRLVDPSDAIARHLLKEAVVYVMPNANPDGTWRGHLRTNAAGRNLNREWENPCAEDSPEIYNLLAMMEREGVDLCIDVHGDEALPYNFIAGSEGIPGWSERMKMMQDTFSAAFRRSSPDFQTKFGYEVDAPNEANMKICSNAVAQKFDCLAVTLEMPFKDTADFPDPISGWSPQRAKSFGASMLPAVYEVLPLLRD